VAGFVLPVTNKLVAISYFVVVLAPPSGVRHENSFTEGSDEELVSPKGQISQKIPKDKGIAREVGSRVQI
jgi:hypothetical protein